MVPIIYNNSKYVHKFNVDFEFVPKPSKRKQKLNKRKT